MSKTKSAYEQMRLEFNRPSTREELEEKLGCVCANCGSDLDVEYHHVVPLKLGGSNRLTNIVPLCFVCHKIAHGARNIRKICHSERGGRPRMSLKEDYKEVLEDFLCGRIDRDTCYRKIGLFGANKLTDKPFSKSIFVKTTLSGTEIFWDIKRVTETQLHPTSSTEMVAWWSICETVL